MVALCALGANVALADPSVKIDKVESVYPWVSGEGKIKVDYSLAGLDSAYFLYKVVFDVTAGGKTASVTNDAAKLTEGQQPQKAIDTAVLFDEETVAKDAEVKISLVAVPGGVQLWEGGPIFAECNVGATKPEEYGYYFWWGDTVGYKRSSYNSRWVSAKDGTTAIEFTSSDTTAGQSHDSDHAWLEKSGWIDGSGNLVVSNDAAKNHDAARAHLGAPWRMMTDAELQKLVDTDYCTTKWTTQNGVYGRKVTGKGAYASNSIFLPAAGYGSADRLDSNGSYGYYWSSTPTSGRYYAYYFYFYSDAFRRNNSRDRYYGFPVRPVRVSAEGEGKVVATADADFWLGPGCESCPWTVGDDVTAYITGEELDIVGTGEMYDFASAEDVPWAAFVGDVTAVTIAEDVTKVGANSWAEMDDAVEINGTALSAVRFLAPGVNSPAPTEPSGAVCGAEPETVRIVDGKVLLGVSVCTNGDLAAETESWGPAKLDPETVEQAEDGMGLVIPVPATAEKGFMLLKSKGAVPSDFKEPPHTTVR